MAKSMDDIPSFDKNRRWYDGIQVWEFEDNVWHEARPYGLVYTDFKHTIKTKKEKFYPEYCHGYDVEKDAFYEDREERCEACRLNIYGATRYFMNVICKETEAAMPANPKSNWTPIYMMELSSTLFKAIKGLKQLNGGEMVTHSKKGAIIGMKFDPQAKGTEMFSISLIERNVPITDAQLAYTALQEYADGSKKVHEANFETNTPAQYEYCRQVNSRQEMRKSLERHGYYDDEELQEVQEVSSTQRASAVSQAKQSSAIGVMPEHSALATEMPDEDPLPKRGAATVSTNPSSLASKQCPTSYGNFAQQRACYTDCEALTACREATASSNTLDSNGDDDDL